MGFSKKCCNLNANSLLESIIALTIISICLYLAIMIYAIVFSSHTSASHYAGQNKANALFFLMQTQADSIMEQNGSTMKIEEEWINSDLKQISVSIKDSSKVQSVKRFYIQDFHE